MNFILEVRRRIQAGEEVSDDGIRDAVKLIRVSRADAARTRKGGSKTPVLPVTFSDF